MGSNPIPTKRGASFFALRATPASHGRMALFSTDLSGTCHAPVAKILYTLDMAQPAGNAMGD